EGMFRAVHRKVGEEGDYKVPGTYHSFRQQDAMPLVPGETVRLSFALLPISYLVAPGHRLRISITGVDPQHFDIPKMKPTSMQLIAGNGESFLMIPIEKRH